MNQSFQLDELVRLQNDVSELRDQLLKHQIEKIKVQEKVIRRQRYTVGVLLLTLFILLVLGGFWSGPVQAQAKQTLNAVSGPSVTFSKFCAGCNRSGSTLPTDYDLKYAYLSGADYTGSALQSVNFMGAFLRQGNFTNANLTSANLSYTTLSDSTLTTATMTGANLATADLERADASNVLMTNVTLTGANLTKALFSNTDLSGSDLSDTVIDKTNFINANLTNANLSGATGTPFSIDNVIWNHAICPDNTNADDNAGTCAGHFIT